MQNVQGTANTFAVVRSILCEHGVDLSPEGEAFVAAKLTGLVSIGGGKAFIATPGEIEPVQDLGIYLHGLLSQSETRRYFIASKSNSPTVGSSENPFPVNPFTNQHRNISRQMLIERKDPALAERLRNEAVKSDAQIRNAGDPNNPFSKAGWNLTAQMKLIKSNPEHAKYLEANANA